MQRLRRGILFLLLGAVVLLVGQRPPDVRAALPAPMLITPAAGAVLSGMEPTLSWELPQGATQYQLQVLPANNDGPAINLIRNAATSFTIPAPPTWYVLLPDMGYTWRVRTTDLSAAVSEHDPGWGAWSEERTFRTPPFSGAGTQAVTPANGETVGSTSPLTLRWNTPDPAIFYVELQVSGDARFDTDPATATSFVWWNLVHGGVTNPPHSWQTPALNPATTYYWRIRPRVQGDGIPAAWSPTYTFRAPALAGGDSNCASGGTVPDWYAEAGSPCILAGSIAGAAYVVAVPRQWNGTLLLYSHGLRLLDDVTPPEFVPPAYLPAGIWLLNRGYALAGSTFRSEGWVVAGAVLDQLALLDHFTEQVGRPKRTIAWGYSIGGLVTAGLAENYPERLAGALSVCAPMGGAISYWNTSLDALFVLKTLVDPTSPLQVVRSANPAADYDLAQQLVMRAHSTPQGQARLALAAAMGLIPGWYAPPAAAQPLDDDFLGQEQHQVNWLLSANLFQYIITRAHLEQLAGGNPSWNTDANYDDMLARAPSARQVRTLYERAGLSLAEDMTRLRNAPRIAPDLNAVPYLAQNLILSGKIGVPMLTLHDLADGVTPVENEQTYATVVQAAGKQDLLRQLYVRRAGHCVMTNAEVLTAIQVLVRRLDTGSWEDTQNTAALRAAATALGPNLNGGTATGKDEPAFIPLTPAGLLRPFTPQ